MKKPSSYCEIFHLHSIINQFIYTKILQNGDELFKQNGVITRVYVFCYYFLYKYVVHTLYFSELSPKLCFI